MNAQKPIPVTFFHHSDSEKVSIMIKNRKAEMDILGVLLPVVFIIVIIGAIPSVLSALDHTSNSTTGAKNTTETEAAYIVYNDDGIAYAKNGTSSRIDYSSSNLSATMAFVFNTLPQSQINKVILKGSFNVPYTISLPSNLDLSIEGSLNVIPESNFSHVLLIDDQHDVKVSGGYIDGNNDTHSILTNGILISSGYNIIIENVNIRNMSAFGIYFYDSIYSKVVNCQLFNIAQSAIAVENYGVPGFGFDISHNTIIESGLVGSVAKNGIHFEGQANMRISDCIVSSNIINSAKGNGILLMNTDKTLVTQNSVVDCHVEGICLASCNNNTIGSNYLRNNDVGLVNGYDGGIRLDDNGVTPGSSYNIIFGNNIIDHRGAAISERGNADHNDIKDNNVEFNGVPQIYKSGTHTRVDENRGFITVLRGSNQIAAPYNCTKVTHAFGAVPSVIIATAASKDVGFCYITNIDGSYFDIWTENTVPSGTITVYWECYHYAQTDYSE